MGFLHLVLPFYSFLPEKASLSPEHPDRLQEQHLLPPALPQMRVAFTLSLSTWA